MEDGESKTRRRSVRTPKRKDAGIEQAEFPPNKKPFRKCEKAGCPSSRPSCFSKATAGCARDGYTSRWYHISNREHFCNECFDYFYRSNKDGNARYTDWKLKSAANCQKELTLKLFFAEEILGYWVNCAACKKWRAVPDSVVENGIIDPYWSCGKADELKCSDPESEFVTEAKSMSWLNTLTYTPLIKFDSPFSTLKEYYSDGIGFSTLSTKQEAADDDEEKKDFIQPFYSPSDAQKAGSCNPDIMQADEKEAFPELSRQAPWIFLGIRNVVLSLWNTNVKEFHTLEKCMAYINVRGLARITMAEILKDILDFLTLRGRINFGIMENIPNTNFLHGNYFKGSVVVIGAGVSGISSANQLQRAGCKVQILEAREDIGGRVKDDNSLGVLVSQGPQIITGYINNPFTIMSEQTDSTLRILRPRCNLLDSQGTIADEEIDQKVEFYFNLMLESLEELKAEDDGKCLSLKDSFEARKKDLEAQIYRELTEEEHHLLEFHLANLEYACGASLEKISAFHWNQNEAILQYSGDHAWVKSGFKTILNKLSLGLNIRLGYVVSAIDYSGSQVKIECSNGKEFFADKVILTVPLSMLKREKIKFNPKLPEDKSLAISHLGAGCIEKVVMKFKNNFWTDKIGNADYFGRVPDSSQGRGFSCLFYDVSDKTNYILLALIAGDSVQEIKEMPEQEIVSRCVQTLAKFFPEKKVPKPSKYFVSRWSKEEHIEMTYSYVGLEGNGDDYDQMAKQIDNKLYFAGEIFVGDQSWISSDCHWCLSQWIERSKKDFDKLVKIVIMLPPNGNCIAAAKLLHQAIQFLLG